MPKAKRDKIDGWPVIYLDSVYHVGTLDPSHKGKTHNACSHEGTGLSVSLHPEAWMRIAKLGGNPTWELQAATELPFVDVLRFKKSHWTTVHDWSVEKGLLDRYDATVVSYFDDDLGYEASLYFEPRDPTDKSEIDWYMEEDEAGGKKANLKTEPAFSATAFLNAAVGFRVGKGQASELAMTLFCEEVLADRLSTTGIWWNEDLNPLSYSAPRGVIHVKKLENWAPQESTEERKKERQHP